MKTFADFDVDDRITASLAAQGITTPFPIQELTLPLALSGADLIGQARTGTGKTLAFGLPLLQRVDTSSDATQALVIVPTRELCLQVHDDLSRAGSGKDVRVVAAYGGRAIDPQAEAIESGAEVVVGTPGRLLDLVRRGLLVLSTVTTLVLDEADEMLDMGFLPDVEQLIEATSAERQTLLFSATMPSEVVSLARRYMRKPTFMRADVEESRIAPETRQHFFAVHRMDKPALVARILRTPERGRCVIFTRTKRMADMLVSDLREAGLNAAAIHSDLRQEMRERTLAKFRSGAVDVMCATEVAARGLDIDEVTHVINYDCPDDEKMYLHRIGRTGRAGADGVAVTLAIWSELARLDMIKKALDVDEPTLEVFSTSAVLDELFPLPTQTGSAPREQQQAPSAGQGGDRPDEGAAASGPRRRSRSRRARRGTEQRGHAPAASEPARPATEPTDGPRRDDRAGRDRRPAEGPSGERTAARRTDDDRPQVRRRTRRRTVTPAGTAPAADRADRGAEQVASGASQDRGGARGEDASPPTPSPPTPTPSPPTPSPSSATPAGRDRAAAGRSGSSRRGRRSSGRGKAATSRPARAHGTARGESTDDGRVAAPAGPVDVAAARGDGVPGLRRLVRIRHLP